MKRAKKALLVLLSLVLLSQIPFAYRRYQLGRLYAAVQQLNSERRPAESRTRFSDYKGVAHVHSSLGGHSAGTFSEIISAAQVNELQFVIMTEHAEQDFDTANMTLRGVHGGVLFVNGNEVRTKSGDRLLVIPGDTSMSEADKLSTRELAEKSRTREALAIVAYPDEFKSWDVDSLDAIEIYNVYTNAKRINPVVTFFDVLWSQRSYPDLLFATFYQRPNESLKKWDEALTRNRLPATAGNDAHSNVGISLNDASGKALFGLQLDPYETSFRLVRLHVLIPQNTALDTTSLLQAVRAGHCFLGFDLFGDTSGFTFEAENPAETKIQGDEITLRKDTRLKVSMPIASRVLLFKDGKPLADGNGITTNEYPITERGVYRVEVYLPQLGKVGEQPWIISNPIYVR
jgi:hypothetical protein